MGSIYFPNEILDSLQIRDSDSFYKDVFLSDYPQMESLLKESESNYDYVYSDNDSDEIPYWCHYD